MTKFRATCSVKSAKVNGDVHFSQDGDGPVQVKGEFRSGLSKSKQHQLQVHSQEVPLVHSSLYLVYVEQCGGIAGEETASNDDNVDNDEPSDQEEVDEEEITVKTEDNIDGSACSKFHSVLKSAMAAAKVTRINGIATFEMTDDSISLNGFTKSIIGSTLVLHVDHDFGQHSDDEKPMIVGRLACGEIVSVK